MKDRTVLFVDDEFDILNSLKRGLIDEDYKCLFAMSGAEALEKMEKEDVSVIVTDMRMPGMDGLKLLKIVKERYPNTVRVVLSGYTQLQQVLTTVNQGEIFKFIAKPWKLEDEFKPIIRQALEYYNLQMESINQKKSLEARNASYQNIFKSMVEKIDCYKRDFGSIKTIASYTINRIMDCIAEAKVPDSPGDSLLNRVDLIRQLYLEYVNILPTSYVNFELKNLVKNIETCLNEMNFPDVLEIDVNKAQNALFYGDYKLLCFILVTLLKRLPKNKKKGSIKFTITTSENNQGMLLDIFIEINRNTDNGSESKIDESELSIINSFLNELSLIISGNIVIHRLNGNYLIKIQVQLKTAV